MRAAWGGGGWSLCQATALSGHFLRSLLGIDVGHLDLVFNECKTPFDSN